MFNAIKNHSMKLAVAAGSLGALALGSVAHAAADTAVTTPIQSFIDYGKENTLAVIGVVLLGVGAIFAVALGVKLAMKWIHRAAK